MKKISTLFKKDPNDLGRVINEINPENQWVIDCEGVATIKRDGAACAIIDGAFYKRYDVKKGRQVPFNSIPCQAPDPITGHWPHWVWVTDGPEDKAFREAIKNSPHYKGIDGTYEAIGPKINGNKEGLTEHVLVKHGSEPTGCSLESRTWDGIKNYLTKTDIEGIVFHHPDGRMCKIRKSDFGIRR